MSATRTLASYLSNIKYDDLPPEVIEKAKLAILDTLGNMIGGYPLSLSTTFLELTKDLGGGRGEATLIGDGTKVSVPLAAFGNGALASMLDYNDGYRNESGKLSAVPGALSVTGALSAGEPRGISGQELISSVVAGYECMARIVQSMDMSWEQEQKVKGADSIGVCCGGGGGKSPGTG